jgi:hypothetical protein
MSSILDKIPAPLRSLWDSEVELRRAFQNTVFMRREEASQHWAEAKRHFSEALEGFRRREVEGKGEWGSYSHTAATLQNHRDAEERQPETFKPGTPPEPRL